MYLLLQHSYISEPLERRAQNPHAPISMLLYFCLSVYRCSPVPGPRGHTLRSHFKWSPYSSVLRPETNGYSRSLVSVCGHEKNVSLCFCELCAWLCALVLVIVQSLQSTCEAHLVLRLRWKVHLQQWIRLSSRESAQSALLQGACADLWLAHILLSRISAQTWFIGPLTWYGEWRFGTELCCFSLLWLLKYFPTIWFLDLFILITWCCLDNFDFTTCK